MTENEIFIEMENKINDLISVSEFEEAAKTIRKIQIGLISMQSVVLIKQFKYYEVEELLIKTLKKEEENFDLLYNLAYVYEMTGRYDEAIDKYKQAIKCNNNKDIINEIDEIIKMISKNHKYEPLVTVCMPVYNDEKDIVKAVNSVLNQTYQNFEVIVCDNNSEDRTFELLSSFKNNKIRLIKNEENIGWMLNSNKVLKLAKGKYIVTLHGDDSFKNNYIENVVRIFESNKNVGIIHFIDENMKKAYFENITYFKSEKYYSKIASLSCMPAPTQTAFRRDAIINTNYYEKEYWTAEARLSMKIAEQGFDAYIEGKYLFERYSGQEKDSSQISKRVLMFMHLYHFYEEYKNDTNIEINDLTKLKNKIVQIFIDIHRNKGINKEFEKAFVESKELLKSDVELSNTIFDYVFN